MADFYIIKNERSKKAKVADKKRGSSYKLVNYSTKYQLRALFAAAGVTQKEIARRLGISPQAVLIKLGRKDFAFLDLKRYANLVGAELEANFVFPDGTTIPVWEDTQK